MVQIADATSSRQRWYAVQTKARQEERARTNLISLGVETFLPKIRRSRTCVDEDGRHSRSEPLFPRYLFVRCDGLPMARQIRNTRGVACLLSSESGPTAIDEDIIDVLRQRTDGDGFVSTARAFKAGDAIRVTSGPLRDLVGVFDARLCASTRVAILLHTLHGYVRVVIEGGALRPS